MTEVKTLVGFDGIGMGGAGDLEGREEERSLRSDGGGSLDEARVMGGTGVRARGRAGLGGGTTAAEEEAEEEWESALVEFEVSGTRILG